MYSRRNIGGTKRTGIDGVELHTLSHPSLKIKGHERFGHSRFDGNDESTEMSQSHLKPLRLRRYDVYNFNVSMKKLSLPDLKSPLINSTSFKSQSLDITRSLGQLDRKQNLNLSSSTDLLLPQIKTMPLKIAVKPVTILTPRL